MIEIDDKIVSADLLRECFACDIARCKGICCVEGNAGAPLEEDEETILESEYPHYKPYMTPEGIAAVERQGFMVVDEEGDYTTPLVGLRPGARMRREAGHPGLQGAARTDRPPLRRGVLPRAGGRRRVTEKTMKQRKHRI